MIKKDIFSSPLPTYQEIKSLLSSMGVKINKRTRLTVYERNIFLASNYRIDNWRNDNIGINFINSISDHRTALMNFLPFVNFELENGIITIK